MFYKIIGAKSVSENIATVTVEWRKDALSVLPDSVEEIGFLSLEPPTKEAIIKMLDEKVAVQAAPVIEATADPFGLRGKTGGG